MTAAAPRAGCPVAVSDLHVVYPHVPSTSRNDEVRPEEVSGGDPGQWRRRGEPTGPRPILPRDGRPG